jgi:protein SCO1/2
MHRLFSILLGMLLLAACSAPLPTGAPDSSGAAGTIIDPPIQLSDFTMASSRGEPLSLSSFAGQPTIIFFGYTFCPDVCPLTLSAMKRVKEQLGSDGERFNVVFISVDAERDTPEVLDRYVNSFDPAFVGLQGDEATLRRIGKEYGLYYAKSQVQNTSASYLVDHSSAAYLIDAAGRLRVIYPYGTEPDVITRGVRQLLREQ